MFKIGTFTIDDSNIAGLVSAITYPIIQVLTICFVHDLSLGYDLKENLLVYENDPDDEPEKMKLLHACDDIGMTRASSDREEDSSIAPADQIRNNGTTLKKLARLWKNFDVSLIYFLIFFFHYCGILRFSYLPVLVEKDLKFNAQTFSFLFFFIFSNNNNFLTFSGYYEIQFKSSILYWFYVLFPIDSSRGLYFSN